MHTCNWRPSEPPDPQKTKLYRGTSNGLQNRPGTSQQYSENGSNRQKKGSNRSSPSEASSSAAEVNPGHSYSDSAEQTEYQAPLSSRRRRSSTASLQNHQRNRRKAELHKCICKYAFLVHIVSLAACAAATGLSSGSRSRPYPQDEANDYITKTEPFINTDNGTIPCQLRETVFHVKNSSDPSSASTSLQCRVWSTDSPMEICAIRNEEARAKLLKTTYLFPTVQPISLYQFFSAGSPERHPPRLRTGIDGQDCVSGQKDRCMACYKRLDQGLRRLDEAYRSFDNALLRFDCLPAVDTASATRPFSPNGSCATCRSWYRRWLLVQTVSLWKNPPCVNWCYYAQLACPHLATAKVVDYAGHPSFQCRDLDIPSSHETVSQCDCVHPCDLLNFPQQQQTSAGSPHKRRTDHDVQAPPDQAEGQQHDFYAASAHCRARQRQCSSEPRTTAHDRQTDASPVGSTTPPNRFFSLLWLPVLLYQVILPA